MLDTALAVFSPLEALEPYMAITLMAFAVSLCIMGAYKVLLRGGEVKEIREKMKECRKKSKEAQKSGDSDAVNKNLKEMLDLNQKYMMKSLKPMMASLFIAVLPLLWLRATYEGMAIVALPFSLPFIGASLGWLGWYFVVSMVFTTLFRKLFGIQ